MFYQNSQSSRSYIQKRVFQNLQNAQPWEKEKTIRPRGWKQNNDDHTEQKTEHKKKEAEKKKTRKEKSQQRGGDHGNKDVKMPTADGSRMSKLDKENAEKEIKNKNVWAERQEKGINFIELK